ncbi:MAG: flippase-like domain-containing protein [Deltaproteobacteria bacterium]|nr:flippase-like domain-containing protein [Deltaproteobacteria bacterium]
MRNFIGKTLSGKSASVFLALLASAAFLALAWRAAGLRPEEIRAAFRSADTGLLFGVLAASVAWHVFMGADKMYRVLKSLGLFVPFREILKWRLGSGPMRVILPVDSGEVFDVLYLWRGRGEGADTAAGAVAFESGLNLIGASFWLGFGLVLTGAPQGFSRVVAAVSFGLLYAVFFFSTPLHQRLIKSARDFRPSFGRVASAVLGPFASCPARRKLFFAAYGVVFQTRSLWVCWFLLKAFGYSPDSATVIAGTSIAIFAGHAPSVSGMGPREAAIMLFLAGSAPQPVLFSVGLLLTLFVHVIPMLVGAPWALWFFGRLMAKRSEP